MYRKHIQEMESTNKTSNAKTGLKTLDKITELPIVDTTLNTVTDYYGQIKGTNGILRTGCNLAEMSFKTLRFASTPISTMMSGPIEHVDTYLSEKVDYLIETTPSIKKPTNEITSAAYTQAKDLYGKTNEIIYKPKETLYNFKDLTVSTATTCGSKVIETCLENRYARAVTNPFLDYTERTLNYYLPENSLNEQTEQGAVTRLYNINRRVYNHVYDTTFIQLSKLHMHFERTIEKMQALKNLMVNVFTERKNQVVSSVSEFTLVQRCQTYFKERNITLERLEELSRGYYKAILADVNDIIDRYMGLIKNFPAYFNGNQFREKIDFLKNQLNRETFQIYLSTTIDYLKQINQSLMTYTKKMIEVGESKMYLSKLISESNDSKAEKRD